MFFRYGGFEIDKTNLQKEKNGDERIVKQEK
jgi:hypothetical protein